MHEMGCNAISKSICFYLPFTTFNAAKRGVRIFICHKFGLIIHIHMLGGSDVVGLIGIKG